jgi:purine-binding chemotaxis protein CheW
MGDRIQFCTFFAAGHFFGVEVLKVQEVIQFQELTEVPLAPTVVEGLINLRGEVVTALDLRRRLELKERDKDTHPLNVVLRSNGNVTSLLVDEIGDVLELDSDAFEGTVETVAGIGRELIRGVYKLKERLLLVLDVEKTIQIGSSDGPERKEN